MLSNLVSCALGTRNGLSIKESLQDILLFKALMYLSLIFALTSSHTFGHYFSLHFSLLNSLVLLKFEQRAKYNCQKVPVRNIAVILSEHDLS